MKQSSKERLATLLMDELLERLSERESIRKMLGEMASLPINDVIEHLLSEFEQAVEEYHKKHQVPKKRREEAVEPAHSDVAQPDPAPLSPASDREPEIEQVADSVSASSVSEESDPADESPSTPASSRAANAPAPPETVSAAPAPVAPAAVPPVAMPPVVASPVAMPLAAMLPVEVSPAAVPLLTMLPDEPEVLLEQPESKKSVPQVEPEVHKVISAEPSVQLEPIRLEFPKILLKVDLPQDPTPAKISEVITQAKAVPQQQSKKEVQPHPAERDEELRKLEELAKKIEVEYAARISDIRQDEPESSEQAGFEAAESLHVSEASDPDNVETEIVSDEEEEPINIEPVGSGRHMAHARYTFTDDEFVYVHAVSKIPDNEEPSPDPFMLEEKGIDGHGFAFALDYEGMRFYLSKINPNEMSISKSMVLLLNKHESLELQGVHESILNDLRAHGILLPLEFGTVARGKDQFFGVVDKNKDDLEEALDEIVKTTRWTVTASVLDSTIAGIVGTDVHTVGRDRSRHRASYTSAPQLKKFDIKVLERILQREKKIAEAVHAELSAVAARSDVETIVGLGSGSSEDWKVIFRASYEVAKRNIGKFNRTVTDLQYHHLQYDLMLSLTGSRDFLTLRRK